MPARPVTVVNVGYRSTNFYVVSAGTSRLLVDLGWPGTFPTLRANLARMDVPLAELRYGVATHYHPDHAGLAQELKMAGAVAEQAAAVARSWEELRRRGARTVHPGHGPAHPLPWSGA